MIIINTEIASCQELLCVTWNNSCKPFRPIEEGTIITAHFTDRKTPSRKVKEFARVIPLVDRLSGSLRPFTIASW